MPVHQRDVHMLAHAARMLVVLDAKPDHAGGPDYQRQIAAYRLRWSQMTGAERTEAVEAANTLHDMSETTVEAAVAALED